MNMIRSAKNQIAELTAAAYRAAVQEGLLPEGVQTIPAVEIPKDTANGDYTTTFCLAASKAMRKNPREVAKILTEHMDLSDTYFTSVEIAGPGFLNFRLGDKWYADVLTAVEEERGDYGRDNWLDGKKYMVEFVSANPTGPMHMGNARGGVLGDTLAEVLDWSGADVWREFYVNDFGNQIEKFAKSIEARYIQLIKGEDAIEFPEDGYHGDDIRELAKAFYDIHGDSYLEKSVKERHADMARFGLERNIPKMKSDLERYGIKFDEWFFESSLHNSGYVKDTVEELHPSSAGRMKRKARSGSRPPTSCASSTASRARRMRTSTSSTSRTTSCAAPTASTPTLPATLPITATSSPFVISTRSSTSGAPTITATWPA